MKIVRFKIIVPLLFLDVVLLYLKLNNVNQNKYFSSPKSKIENSREENDRKMPWSEFLFGVERLDAPEDDLDDSYEVPGWERGVVRTVETYFDFNDLNPILQPTLKGRLIHKADPQTQPVVITIFTCTCSVYPFVFPSLLFNISPNKTIIEASLS